ncbi:MAG: hypothetical protein IJH12_05260 [Clostridia bacterium]|nr:hypothetical protein [Clostridia bacterium]
MNLSQENFRSFLNEYIAYYKKGREKIGIPFNSEEFEEKIKKIDIIISDRTDTTGTFQVNQRRNSFEVIQKSFSENGIKRNIFLLLHEFTHLDSKFNANLPSSMADIQKYDEFESIKNNDDLSKIDVYNGFIAIDEVIAQWCCEQCNSALNTSDSNTPPKLHQEKHSILGTEVITKTDFSNHDIYAPLEQYVELLAKKLGYKDLSDFSIAIITGKETVYENITNENIEMIGYIGILCEGIYQENGFQDYGLPATDIPKAIQYLNGRNNNFPAAPNGEGIDR